MASAAFLLLLGTAAAGCLWNWQAAASIRSRGTRLRSVSAYHGLFSLLVVLIPTLTFVLLWQAFQGIAIDAVIIGGVPDRVLNGNDASQRQLAITEIRSIAAGQVFGEPEDWTLAAAARLAQLEGTAHVLMIASAVALALALAAFSRRKVRAEFNARESVESLVSGVLLACSAIAVLTTAGIVASLALETANFLRLVPLADFLFGLNWEPQIPIREDQLAAEGAFGWIPVILGTVVITAVAVAIAIPVGLLSAIYLNEFAPGTIRAAAKPILEILAGVPTVVYGFFAILVVAPAMRTVGTQLGIPVSPNSALAAGAVMGIMLTPFISSFAEDAFSSVPSAMRDGALALGSTRAEMMLTVLFPAALPGIVGGVLLAASRAIGETMIVVMAAGLIAKLTINPLDSVTTVTVQIMTLLIGDTSFDDPKTLAAFALGMMLFLVTLCINVAALKIVRKYREKYE